MSRIRSQINNIKLGKDQNTQNAHSNVQMSEQNDPYQAPMQSSQLEKELQRVETSISTLRNDNTIHPQYLDEMELELKNLKMGIAKISGDTSAKLDLNEIAQSIESGYSEIASKLDSFFQSSQTNNASQDNFDRLEARIAGVSNTVEQLANSAPVPSNNDQEHFNRLEQSIANVSNTVEQLAHTAISQPKTEQIAHEISSGLVEPLSLQIERLSQKIDNMPAMNTASSGIVEEFTGVTQRLDSLQSNFNALSAQIADIAPQDNSKEVGDAFGMIESRIGQLAQKLDVLSQENNRSDDGQGQEILSVLRELTQKVDSIPPSKNSFKEIEAGLAAINSQLGNVQTPELNIDPITDRLENIESQIASSRDIVIDMATEAANRSGNVPNDTSLMEPRLEDISLSLNAITERLAEMENSSAELAATIENGQRMGLLAAESDFAEKEVETGNNTIMAQTATHVDTSQNAQVQYEKTQVEATPAEAAPVIATDSQTTHTPIMEEAEISAPAMTSPVMGEVKNAQLNEQSSEAIEDVPLEPGSGMPDIQALVKQATQRKKEELAQGGVASDHTRHESDRNNDLISAARRAAKASATNSQIPSPEKDGSSSAQNKLSGLLKKMKKEPAKKNENTEAAPIEPQVDAAQNEDLSASADPNAGSSKLKQGLMASVAVLALGFAAYTVVPKFLNNQSTQVASSNLEAPSSNASLIENDSMNDEPTSLLAPEVSGKVDEVVDEVEAIEETAELSSVPSDVLDPQPTLVAKNNSFEKANPTDSSVTNTLQATSEPEDKFENELANADPLTTPPAEVGNELLIKAAATGDVNALFEVGRRYSDGDIVARSFVNAAKWYELAASKGHALSQYRIGNFYEKGHGVDKDLAKAAIWYEQSANKGNALAMHNLAVLKATGAVDKEPDMERAIDLFTQAANLGVKDSQVNLGILYTQGMGTEKNLEEAYKWFSVASRAGDKDAGKKRDIVANAMRPEQLKVARSEAEAWKPSQLNVSANTATVSAEWKNSDVKRVSKKDIVRQTQSLLTRAGFDPGPADGLFGLKTQEAIIKFQKKVGMPADGEISPSLLKALSQVKA